MSRTTSEVLRAAGWAVLAFGALSIARLPGEDQGEFCGVWGCLPPLQALAAMHAFWAVVAAAVADFLLRHVRPPWLNALGVLFTLVGLLLLTAIAVHGTVTWLQVTGWQTRYVGRRVLYVIAMATDAPCGQMAAAGAVCWWVARRRERVARNSIAEGGIA
jgi:hypothetical protein